MYGGVLFVLVLCTQFCQFLWSVHSELLLRFLHCLYTLYLKNNQKFGLIKTSNVFMLCDEDIRNMALWLYRKMG